MFRAMKRARRGKAWKSQRKWQHALRKKQRHEDELRQTMKYAQPDRWINVRGVVIGVHLLRSRFRGPLQYRFEFYRKDSAQKGLAVDFGEDDLPTLVEAVQAATRYRKFVESRESSNRSRNHGTRDTKPSKAASRSPRSSGSRK